MSSLRVLIAGGDPEDHEVTLAELQREWPTVALGEFNPHGEVDPSEARPDLLLVVSNLELEDSVAVLSGARDRWPDLPVVILAGAGSEETAVEAMQIGFDGHVSRERIARLAASAQAAIRHRGEAVRARQVEARVLQAQKLEAVGRLAAGIAHDFNNLLGVIDGYAALIAETTPEPDERHAHALEIARAEQARRRADDATTCIRSAAGAGGARPRSA